MPTASGRALSLADELESWIRLASRSAVDAFGERPETKCVEVNTDITMQDMEEWCQVEAEISQEGLEVSDEKAEALQGRLRGIALEEQQLNEELANLKAQLKQEKAFNHQQNQAHQQQVRKLKQALNKQKKEAEAKEQQRRKEEAKVKQAKEESAREEAKLKQQLQQARELNQKLKDKLQESNGEDHRGLLKDLRMAIHTLKCSLVEEHEKEKSLHEQLEKNAEEDAEIEADTKHCVATVRLLSQQAIMLKQMVNVSNAELDGWNEQVGRLQERKQEARDTAKERQVMEKCAKKYQQRQQGLPDEKDSEGKTVHSDPSGSRRSSRSVSLVKAQ
ncbi:unnamed protein product [Durusdinium trenchii]|uniref:Uncharacterized protein n=1 Tax=Durusdinium trenchii TaxID=1381693 RepID=A0ABP0P1C4_9DINO